MPVDLFIRSQRSSIAGTPLGELRGARASNLGIFNTGIQLGRATDRNLELGRSLYNQALHHGRGDLDLSVSKAEGASPLNTLSQLIIDTLMKKSYRRGMES